MIYLNNSTNKYKNKKVRFLGEDFDSKKEKDQWLILKHKEAMGEIKDLQRQVEFELIPAQYEEIKTISKTGKIKITKKLIERKCSYIADFVYTDTKTNERIVADVKGYDKKSGKFIETPEFKIKRKLMLYIYKIKIREL